MKRSPPPFYSLRELVCQNKPDTLKAAIRTTNIGYAKLYAHTLNGDCHGQTLLMYAIRKKRPECAMVIATEVAGGTYLNKREQANRGSTALHLAAQKGYYDLVVWMVRHGADVNIYDAESHTPLSLARAGPTRSFLMSVSSDLWKRWRWRPRFHLGCPPEFQSEAKAFAGVNWRLRLVSKDILSVVLEWLLELHRREFRNEGELPYYFDPNQDQEPSRCTAITKKGTRCKFRVKYGMKVCAKHR